MRWKARRRSAVSAKSRLVLAEARATLFAAHESRPRRTAPRLSPFPQHFHRSRARAGRGGVRGLAGRTAGGEWARSHGASHSRASHRGRAQCARAGAAHGADLRALRRAAGRSAGAVADAALRAADRKRRRLCPRRGGQQRTDLCPRHGHRRDAARNRRATGESHRAHRGRGGNRQRASGGVSHRASRGAELRCHRHLGHRDARAGRAHFHLRPARYRGAGTARHRPGHRPALRHLRRRGGEPRDGARAAGGEPARRRRTRGRARLLRRRGAAGNVGA